MNNSKILLVDNDADFLATRRDFLEEERYDVVTSSSPSEAKEKLEHENMDLAVIDIRLLNDDDEKDTSGLELAKEASRVLPVIILTGYRSEEHARHSLETQLDGTHIAYHFLAKEEGPTALLSIIRRTLEIDKRQENTGLLFRANAIQKLPYELKGTKLHVPEQMEKDYELARLQAHLISSARLWLMIGGVIIFLFGVLMVILGNRDVGIVGAIGGAIAETLGGLMTKYANDANRRWEQFHKELMLLYKNKTQRKKQ